MKVTNEVRPLSRAIWLAAKEKHEILVIAAYATAVVLFGLLVPIATQSLVNTVAQGIFLQPLIVLGLLVFAALLLAGVIQILQYSVVESIQRRVFATSAIKMADIISRVCPRALINQPASRLVKRFFDVVIIQKSLAKLLVDGLTALVQTLLGLAFLGVNSPALFFLDLSLIVFLIVTTLAFGYGGVGTAINESKAKYEVADALEDLARSNVSIKVHGNPSFGEMKADAKVVSFLQSRQRHFAVFVRQASAFYICQAIVQALALVGGGFQVISGSLSIGQLVSAQLIISLVLVAMEKLLKQTEKFFDLLASLDKVGVVLDLRTEREGGNLLAHAPRGIKVECRNVNFSYIPERKILEDLNLVLEPGARMSLVGASGAGKSTLGMLLCGLDEPSHGTIEFDGIELRTLALESMREQVSMIGCENELFDGTIEENILVGRTHITPQMVHEAVRIAQLQDDLSMMSDGLATRVQPDGMNLSKGQIQRILIARAVATRPRLLILDEAFTGIDERLAHLILDQIFHPDQTWTVIDISQDTDVIMRSETIAVIEGGRIVEQGSVDKLLNLEYGHFSTLFPYTSAAMRARKQEGQ